MTKGATKQNDAATVFEECEEIAAFLEATTEDEMIAAYLAANPAAAIQEAPPAAPQQSPPKRPEFMPPFPPRQHDHEGQKALWASRVRTEAETNALPGTLGPDLAIQAARRNADRLEAEASKPMPLEHYRIGAGGELVPDGAVNRAPAPWRDTVATPSLITAEAAQSRLEMANECGVLSQTLDICETIGAENSLERQLAAQMALANKVAMQSGKFAAESFDRANGAIADKYREACSIQGQRAANTMARASALYQSGMLTLQKVRSGGKQNITVTHIQNTQVNDGGQAVVTSGPVATPGAGSEQGGGTV